MTDQAVKPEMLRIVSAVLLGCVVGIILFLIFALGIGALNDRMHMNIPVNLLVAENLISAVLLAVFVLVCSAVFLRMVWTTPAPDSENGE